MADFSFSTIKVKKELGDKILDRKDDKLSIDFQKIIPIPKNDILDSFQLRQIALREWGAPCNAQDPEVKYDKTDDTYSINFTTEWCDPQNIIKKIVQMGKPGEVYAYSINQLNNYFNLYRLGDNNKFTIKSMPHNINAFSKNKFNEMRKFFEKNKNAIDETEDLLPEELSQQLYDIFLAFHKYRKDDAFRKLIEKDVDTFLKYKNAGLFEQYPIVYITEDKRYRIYFSIDKDTKDINLTMYDVYEKEDKEVLNLTINGNKVSGEIMFPSEDNNKMYEFNKGTNSLVKFYSENPDKVKQLIMYDYGRADYSYIFSKIEFDETHLQYLHTSR